MKYSKKTMMAILEFIVVCLAIFFVFKGIIMPVKVDGSSMYPTLHDGDLAFMSRLDLNSKQIKRFDIVTIDCKQLDNVIIKRVIGLPGEKIVYKNDCLYVNGKYIKENYLNKSHLKDVKSRYNISYFTDDFEISVGENEIFVLGDNRVNSLDSRELGCFKIEDVLSENQGLCVRRGRLPFCCAARAALCPDMKVLRGISAVRRRGVPFPGSRPRAQGAFFQAFRCIRSIFSRSPSGPVRPFEAPRAHFYSLRGIFFALRAAWRNALSPPPVRPWPPAAAPSSRAGSPPRRSRTLSGCRNGCGIVRAPSSADGGPARRA